MEALLPAKGCMRPHASAQRHGNIGTCSLHRQTSLIFSPIAATAKACFDLSRSESTPDFRTLRSSHPSNLEYSQLDSKNKNSRLYCVPPRRPEHLLHPGPAVPLSFADSIEASEQTPASRVLAQFPPSAPSIAQEEAESSPNLESRSAGSLQGASWAGSNVGGTVESDMGFLPLQLPPPVIPGESLLHPPQSLPAGICISTIDAAPLTVPLISPFKIASSSVTCAENVAVCLALSDGTVGFGEVPVLPGVTVKDQAEVLHIIETAVKPWLRSQGPKGHGDSQAAARECGVPQAHLSYGQDSEDALASEDAFSALLGSLRQLEADVLPGHEFAAVRAGVEMAVLDAVARSAGVPLWRLFGAECHSIETDITIPICSVEEAGTLAEQYRSWGFRSIKLKVGQGLAQGAATKGSDEVLSTDDMDQTAHGKAVDQVKTTKDAARVTQTRGKEQATRAIDNEDIWTRNKDQVPGANDKDEVRTSFTDQVTYQVNYRVNHRVNHRVNDQVNYQVNDHVNYQVNDQVNCQVNDQVNYQVNHAEDVAHPRDVVVHDLMRIEAIFRAHPGCALLLDANGGYTEEETLFLLRKLRELSLITGAAPQFLEQPVPREHVAAMQHICRSQELRAFGTPPASTNTVYGGPMDPISAREALHECGESWEGIARGGGGMRLVADESCRDAEEALWLAQAGAAHMMNIKLAKMGVLGALDLIASLQHWNRTQSVAANQARRIVANQTRSVAANQARPINASQDQSPAECSSASAPASGRASTAGLGGGVEGGWTEVLDSGVEGRGRGNGGMLSGGCGPKSAGVGFMIGGMVETRLGMGFSAHMAAGLGCFGVVDLDTPLLLASDPVEDGYLMDGSRILLSDKPGAACSIKWPTP